MGACARSKETINDEGPAWTTRIRQLANADARRSSVRRVLRENETAWTRWTSERSARSIERIRLASVGEEGQQRRCGASRADRRPIQDRAGLEEGSVWRHRLD